MTAKNPKVTARVPAKNAPTAPNAPATVNKSRNLHIKEEPGKTRDRLLTDVVSQGLATNATTAARFSSADFGELALTDMVASLREQGAAINRGDLTSAERMLQSQAVALNAIFGELARIAHCNLFKVPDVAERYLRLALKAQGQSRATVETLAAIKNPPVVFARQANINNGGQQQVNNGTVPNSTPASAHPGETASKPTELLEDSTDGRTQLDTRATQTTGRAHQDLAAVGAVNRAAHR